MLSQQSGRKITDRRCNEREQSSGEWNENAMNTNKEK